MSITWVVVANARSATVYENLGPNKGLQLVKEWETTNLQEMDYGGPAGAMDKSGWHGPGELRRNHAKGFAHRIAGELRQARAGNRFSRAVLVAPPTFMGLINAELDPPTARAVSGRLEKDYTRRSSTELCDHLGDCLCP